MILARLHQSAALALLMLLPACAGSVASYPSLAPRAVEKDPTSEPVAAAAGSLALTVTARAASLVETARRGNIVFTAAVASGCTAIRNGVGAREGGEAWVAAQQALSAVDAARSPTAGALDDLNALVLDQARLAENAPAPVDLTPLTNAAAEVAALDTAQRSRLDALKSGACN